jgi:hypothetical protein
VSLYAHEFQSFDTTTALTLIDAGQLKTAAAAAAADRAAGDGSGDSADTAGSNTTTVSACIQCVCSCMHTCNSVAVCLYSVCL